MMQDTILTMCKDSVKEFVQFMVKFIPRDTSIHSTSEVKNTFEKPQLTAEEEEEQMEEDIPESEMTTI